MKWLRAWWRRAPRLETVLQQRLDAWRALRRANPDLSAQRMVVVDVESSGLDPWHDQLISIGAVALQGGAVRLSDVFSTTLRQERPSDQRNILVHRIGGTAQMDGRDAAAALLDFLDFAGKAPLVAFNADFDRVLIERASRAALGVTPDSDWLDLAALAPAVFSDRAPVARTLDDWLHEFMIENYDRHDALADALATAQLLLPVLAAAGGQERLTCAKLLALQDGYRWLGRR
jgi:DNA polymerase-3 subunit epsilon